MIFWHLCEKNTFGNPSNIINISQIPNFDIKCVRYALQSSLNIMCSNIKYQTRFFDKPFVNCILSTHFQINHRLCLPLSIASYAGLFCPLVPLRKGPKLPQILAQASRLFVTTFVHMLFKPLLSQEFELEFCSKAVVCVSFAWIPFTEKIMNLSKWFVKWLTD